MEPSRAWHRLAVRTPAAALLLVLVLTVPAGRVEAARPPEDAVGYLNAQRARNGIPGVAVAGALSIGCANHVAYMARNGILEHGEDPGRPGWTPEGAYPQSAEVLGYGSLAWDAAWANPWSGSPIHLLAVFNPAVTEAGYAEASNFGCMRLRGAAAGLAPVYSLPGPGVVDVPPVVDTSAEIPYSPADLVGIPDRTGYNILLWRPGAYADVASATLSDDEGVVPSRAVDAWTPTGLRQPWPAPGAVVVPVRALKPGTRHQLSVTFSDGVPYTLTFRTAGAQRVETPAAARAPAPAPAPASAPARLKATLPSRTRRGRLLTIRLSQAPGGRRVTVTWRRGGRREIRRHTRAGRTLRTRAPRRAGRYTVVVAVGGSVAVRRTVRVVR